MNAHQFLTEKGVLSVKESIPVNVVQKWLEEFSKIEDKSKELFRSERLIQKHEMSDEYLKYHEKEVMFSFLKEIPIESLKKLIRYKIVDPTDNKLWEDSREHKGLNDLLHRLRAEKLVQISCEILLEK